ncbi:hypothetical protein C1X25_38905, partial [Pseudomonas sp. GW247-3R2A]
PISVIRRAASGSRKPPFVQVQHEGMLSIPCIVRHGDPSGLTQADQAQQLGQFGQTLSHPDCAIKRQTLLELLRGTG